MISKIDEIIKNAIINDISSGCSGDSVKEIIEWNINMECEACSHDSK